MIDKRRKTTDGRYLIDRSEPSSWPVVPASRFGKHYTVVIVFTYRVRRSEILMDQVDGVIIIDVLITDFVVMVVVDSCCCCCCCPEEERKR